MLGPKLTEEEGRSDDDEDNGEEEEDANKPELLTVEGELLAETELLEPGPAVINEPENDVLGIEEALAEGELFTELPKLLDEELGLAEDIEFVEELPEELPPTWAAFPLGYADELGLKLL